MPVETWYVMEDGSVGDPRSIRHGADGTLVHRDGRKVAYAPHGPRSRGVDADVERAKDMRPQNPKTGYLTRDIQNPLDHDGDGRPGGSVKPDDADGDLSAARAEYSARFNKKPFHGWDAKTLREKIAEAD